MALFVQKHNKNQWGAQPKSTQIQSYLFYDDVKITPIIHCLPSKILHKLLLLNEFGAILCKPSKSISKTKVCIIFGEQIERIIGNWKIDNHVWFMVQVNLDI